MSNLRLDAKQVQDQITALIIAYPELGDDEILREDMIEAETGLHEFISVLLRKIGATVSLAEGTRGYVAELKERISRLERREHALRQLIKTLMEAADIRKSERPEATVSIKAGVPRVIVTDEALIPEAYWRIKREPDLTKIKQTIKSNVTVPGTELSNAEPILAISMR